MPAGLRLTGSGHVCPRLQITWSTIENRDDSGSFITCQALEDSVERLAGIWGLFGQQVCLCQAVFDVIDCHVIISLHSPPLSSLYHTIPVRR